MSLRLALPVLALLLSLTSARAGWLDSGPEDITTTVRKNVTQVIDDAESLGWKEIDGIPLEKLRERLGDFKAFLNSKHIRVMVDGRATARYQDLTRPDRSSTGLAGRTILSKKSGVRSFLTPSTVTTHPRTSFATWIFMKPAECSCPAMKRTSTRSPSGPRRSSKGAYALTPTIRDTPI